MSSPRNKPLATCRSPSLSPSLSRSAFASTASGFSSRYSSSSSLSSSSSALFSRATSPTRVKNHISNRSSSPTLRFSLTDRSISPNRSISIKRQTTNRNTAPFSVNGGSNKKRTCACSPTNHPGSFRCSFHRKNGNSSEPTSYGHSSSRLNFRRSAMTNSLVRIGGVEGELVKRALSALIRPSSHQLRRRAAFQPRPSRLSVMSTS